MTDSVAFTAIAAILGLYYFYLKEWDNMTEPRRQGYVIVTALVVSVIWLMFVRDLFTFIFSKPVINILLSTF